MGRGSDKRGGIVFALFIFLLLTTGGTASADWTPPATVTEGGTQYSFGQDVSPSGNGTVVWSGPEPGGGYAVYARDVGANGTPGTKRTISVPDPGAVFTSAYAPAIRYDGSGTATVVWMEAAYGSDSCFSEAGSGPESEADCVVDEYVKSRQIGPAGSLSAVTVLHHREAVYPHDGSFGGSSSAYVSYGQPALAGGPGNTLTAVWTESTFATGCAAYGYSSSYSDSECEAETNVEWVRLSAAGAPLSAPQSAYTTHTTGYGSGHPLMRLRIGAAADGTATVLFSVRSLAGESSCFGGDSSIGFLRISIAGVASAVTQLDSGCGATTPDLAVDPGGTAVAVWGWTGTYSADEALYSRINAAGNAESPQGLLAAGEGDHVSGLDVSRGASGSTVAVWSVEGRIGSRKIPVSGSPGAVSTVALPGAGHSFYAPRLAVAGDGSALVVWEDATADNQGLRAASLAPDGTAGSPHTLLAGNRWDHGSRVSPGPGTSFMVSWRVSVPHHNRIQAARLGSETVKSDDAFADARALDPELPDFASGSNVGATKQAGEPNHAGDPGGHSVWYSWTAAASGPVTLSTCADDGLDPVLAVYTGSTLAGLTAVAAAMEGAPSPCADGDSGVRFEALAGTTYRIAVDGEGGSVGSFGLKLLAREGVPANDAFADAKSISSVPRYVSGKNTDGSHELGEPQHGGDAGGASVWYSWTPTRTATAMISACGGGIGQPLLGVYTGAAVGSLSAVTATATASPNCTLDDTAIRFEALAGTTYRIAVDGRDGREGRFSLLLAQRPANDDFAQAEPLNGIPAYASGSTIAASKQAGEPNHAGDPGGHSVWYSWTPASSGTAFVTACLFAGKDQSALLGVYTGPDVAHLTEVASDQGGGAGNGCFSHYSEVRLDYKAGTTYRIAVDAPGGAETSFQLQIETAPFNDDFAAAQEITGSPPVSYFSTTAHATKQAGEPNHAGDPGGHSVWYSWTAPSNGIVELAACASFSSSPLLAVYTGPDVAHLTEVASDQGGGTGSCFPAASGLEFEASSGTRYYVAVDTPAGVAGSWFRLSLDIDTAPANDEFAAATALSNGPTSISGSNRHATKQAGEPNHAGDPGGASVWYSWTAPSSGKFAISVCAFGSFDPVLAVYTGVSLAALSPVASNSDVSGGQCSDRDAEVTISAVAGTTYRIAVDGETGSTGNFELAVLGTPANDDFAAATEIVGSPPRSISGNTRVASKQAGEPDHAGDPGGHSVWYSWTAPSNDTVKISVCAFGSFNPVLAVYTGASLATLSPVASNDDVAGGGECSSHDSAVTIPATAGTTYRIAVDGHGASVGSFSLELRGTPANDDFAAATALGTFLPLFGFGDNRLATKQASEPDHAGDPGGHSVWYSWTPTASASVKLSTCSYGSGGLDPALAVYTGAAVGALTEVAADKDSGPTSCSNEDAAVQFAAIAGTTYRIAVDGEGGSEGNFQLELRAVGPVNDDFEAAIDVPQEPNLVAGTTAAASRQPNEPPFAEQTVWYRMTATHNGVVRLHTCSDAGGGPMDIQVYTGSTLGSLSPMADAGGSIVECQAPPGPSFTAHGRPGFSFQAIAGVTYRISVDRHFQISPSFETLPAGPFVLVVEPPANDLSGGAEQVPVTGADLSRSNTGATREAGEEPHAGNAGGHSVWFLWFARADGPATIDTCGSAIDTLLSVYDFNEEIAASDDSGACSSGSTASRVSFEAEEGTYYRFAVDGKNGAQGNFALHVHSSVPDTTPPETAAFAAQAIKTTQLTVFAFRDEPESHYECALDGAAFTPCEAPEALFGQSEIHVGSGLTEGPHTVEVREIDLAGNPDPTPVELNFVVDMVAPQTNLTGGPEGLTRLLGPFSFSSNEPGYFECAIDEGSFSFCQGPYSAPESLADGAHTLKVQAVDNAGNQDPTPATRSFNLDRTPPVLTINQGPEGTIETSNVSFSFTASESATLQCALDEQSLAGCASPRSYTNLADGKHTFKVRGTDPAGNVGKLAERSFRVETRPPQTTIESGPEPRTNSGTAQFEFGADEDVSGYECALDGGAFSSCPASHEVAGLGEGSHTIRVRAIDLAGKQDPTPAEQTWVVDTDPPETTIASGPAGVTNKHGPFGFSADEPVSGYECALDNGAFEACFQPYSFPPAPDGEHTVRARAIDQAGNVDPTPATRTLTLDQTPPSVKILEGPPPVADSAVSVTFSVSEPSASAQCRIDSQAYFACASPIEITGIPDGPHTISIRATDTAGNTSTPEVVSFSVDEQPPETFIDQAPEFAGEKATIVFSGSADATEYECALDGFEFAPCASPYTYENLDEGQHEVRVRAIDAVGNVDPTPATAEFSVDRTSPETTITDQPTGPVHDPVLPFQYESSEPESAFECALDEGEFEPCFGFTHDRRPGPHLFSVRAVDQAGNPDPSPATAPFEVVDAPPSAALTLSKQSGPAPLTVGADVGGSDPDDDNLRYTLQWGDGASSEGFAPDSAPTHKYAQPGLYLVQLEVDDGYEATDTVSKLVSVGTPEALVAHAGDDLTAVAGEPVVLDASGSRPLEGIDSYEWSLGDGAQSHSARFTRSFEQPGDYEAQLTVSGLGGTDTDSLDVHVVAPAPAPTVFVHSGSTPIAGALVVVLLPDGRRVEGKTNGSGNARLPDLPDGSYKTYVYMSGYVPATGDLDVSGGAGNGDVPLTPGAAAEISVTSHRMTLEEIEAAGINTKDPANQHVYEFTVNGKFGGYVNRNGFSGGGGCSLNVCHHDGVTTTSHWSPQANAPILTSFKMPARATFLKEFYDLSATVTNLAAPGITLQHGQAAVSVPDGMSLAPTPTPQTYVRGVPDIGGGQSTVIHWILRGDREGEYDVEVSYAASLEPFRESISLSGKTETPIKVWGASALKLEVDLDDEARPGYPYTAFVKLKNVADVPVYNPLIEFQRAGHSGYIEQPRQRHSFAMRELTPGATLTAGPFIFVPEEGGALELEKSVVRKVAGDVDLGGTLVTHVREPSFDATPELSGRWRNDHDLILEWKPVPGATGYEIYSTPDRQTEFGSSPVTPSHVFSPTKAMVTADRAHPPLFAISSIVNGERKMVHPLLDGATAPLAEFPSIKIDDESRCGGETTYARVTLEDPDFPLTGFAYARNAGSLSSVAPLNANVYMKRIDVPRPGAGKRSRITVTATNSNPADGTAKREADLGDCYYVGLGDSFSSGEGALKDGETFEDSNGCHRSPDAYARVIRRTREEMVFFNFKACSGAKTQALFHTNEDHHDEEEQAKWASGAGLVTLSIGGNDLGFVPVLKGCIATYVIQARFPFPAPCKIAAGPIVESNLRQLETTLPGELEKLHKRMVENGRLILVGYPQIFPATKPFPANLPCQLIHPSDISWMHDMVTHANQALLRIANRAGVEFVDPNADGAFDGRDVCEFGSFFNGVRPQELVESFHPNEFGQEAMARAVERRINDEPTTVRVEQGKTITQSILVETANELRAHILWPGSDVELSLESPLGEVIDRAHIPAGVSHDLEATSESYLVPNPEPGEWKLKAKGLEVDEGGEPVSIEVSQTEPASEPPLALFEYAVTEGNAPLKVDFDASASFDPSDQPLAYHWEFGDGSTGTGVKPSHTYASEGEYVTKLTVIDEDGETDTFESPPIVVKAEPLPGSPGTGGGSNPGPAAGGGSAPAPTRPAPPKSVKCKKGFHKKKVHGKSKCVKAKRHKKKGGK